MKFLSILLISILTLTSCHNDRPNRIGGNRNLQVNQTLQDSSEGESKRGTTDCEGEDDAVQSGEEPKLNTEVDTTAPVVVPEMSHAEIFVYFRCNNSGWELSEKNLMKNDGNAFQTEVTISENWMVEFGDACVFTVTDKKGAWTENTKEFVSTVQPTLDSQVYEAVSAKDAGMASFRMKFQKLGRYVVSFSYENRVFVLLPL